MTYANGGLWAMVDGELFLPHEWFGPAFAQRRKELGIPAERTFATKIALGLKIVQRAKANRLPFELLACTKAALKFVAAASVSPIVVVGMPAPLIS